MTKRIRLIALILCIATLLSMFAINAFAHEGEDHEETVTEAPTESNPSSNGDRIMAAIKEIETWEWVTNIVILGLIAIAAVVLGIKFRVKLAAFLRSVKSELKKIVWASGKDTRKNFLVVAVITVSIAIVIAAADYGFGWAIERAVELL